MSKKERDASVGVVITVPNSRAASDQVKNKDVLLEVKGRIDKKTSFLANQNGDKKTKGAELPQADVDSAKTLKR